jgi:hypothetical protein
MTRFDIPQEVQDTLRIAVEQDVIDTTSVYALATQHGDNWEALVDEVCEIAFTLRHMDKSKHAEVVKAAEKFWQTLA